MDRGAAILGNAILDLLLPFIKAECLTRGYVEDREKQGVLRLSAVTLAYFVLFHLTLKIMFVTF